MTEIKQVTIFENDPDSSSYEHKQSVDQLQVQFSKYGLTANQCKVYVFLGKYGSNTAPDVCRALKLPRTETYHLLTTLQNKGVVSATFEHPIKFSAVPLSNAIKSMVDTEKERVKKLEIQEQELTKIWESIPTFHNEPIEAKDDKFQMLQGDNQIYGKINDMIKNTKKEFKIIGNEKDFLKFYHANFLEPLDKSNVELQILTDSSPRTLYVFDEIDKTNVKKIPTTSKGNICYIIKDNEEVLFFMKNSESGKENITAMWTNSEAMIYSKKLLFDLLWLKSKSV
ncbi:MAG TPA: helix-turn-helix domain-containing protein [Nitrosopumilaceae archaeon]|jgi:sugar-specific transcriptional regulator TrmB|nr:helix-turn-helix domain-containing protein [Nitrosopumilaceae archaeon]